MNKDQLETTGLDYDIKFAHGEGHTVFAINEKRGKLLTGGSDGDVRCWSIEQLDEDPESYDVGTPIFSLVTSPENYYVASDSIDVKYYDLQGTYKGSVVRSTLNLYSLCLSDDHKLLASGGGDFIIKIVNLEDHSIKQITSHNAPILSLKFDPKRIYLTSSSCDGTVQIWNIENLNDIKNIKKFDNNHQKSNDFSNSPTLCAFAWSPDGNLLAIPNDEKINLYERDIWTCKSSVGCEVFKSISICEFDKSGRYLAASNSSGILMVWNLSFKEIPIAVFVNENNTLITCFRFNPSNSEKLIASDKSGQLIFIDIKHDNEIKKIDKKNINSYAAIEDINDGFEEDEFDDVAFMKDLDKIDINTEDQMNHKIEKNQVDEYDEEFLYKEKFTKSKFSSANKKRIIESDSEDSNQMPSDIKSQTDSNFDSINPSDDELIDLGALKQKYESKINGSLNENNPSDKSNEKLDHQEQKCFDLKIKSIMQSAFKPGSTPIELEHRFMVWNSVGIVTSSKTETENLIDVEFHNSDVYRPIHLPNIYNYTMADLNTDSLLLAVPASENKENEEDSVASMLFCMNFNSWDNNKEWRYQLPIGESIETIALSLNFALAATDQRKIRLFTTSGIQLHLFSTPGPLVCLNSQDNLLQIIYHNGSGLPGEQSVSMNLLKLNERSVHPITQLNKAQIPISLSPKSVIEWAGFTDEGNACVVDSNGSVKLFNFNSNCWFPVADLRSKNKNDHYFVISISEIQEQIRCVSCKGAKYPSILPKPDVLSVPFEIPLCELTTTKAKLEEQLIRLSLKKNLLDNLSSNGFDVDFTKEENTKKQIEILIKLFALAVNAECNSLAIEIAGLMPNQLAIEGAIRYASQKNRSILIGKLNKMSREKFNSLNSTMMIEENPRKCNRLVNSNSKSTKKRQAEDDEDALKPKQIKMTNSSNPFRIRV